jgi:hypothetical protein
MTQHVFTCCVGRVDASVSTPIDVTTGATGCTELAYDPSKHSSGQRLVPLPYLLFLASFNLDAKNSEASTLLPEGDA